MTLPPPRKKLFIKTYGCQMNVYDSARMADAMQPAGYELAATPEDADMVILNTCHIREKAAEKVYSELGRLRQLKESRARTGRPLTLGVAGCVAQAEGEEILRRAPAVDLVVGPQAYHNLPDLAARVPDQGKVVEMDFPPEDKFSGLPPVGTGGGKQQPSAFLAIQEGCDKFCTFCVVPYTRGAEYSRPAARILDEARRLVAAGAREITLLGQNVNGWRGEGEDGRRQGLGELLFALARIDGLARLRYTTSHPRDMNDGLLAAHRDLPQLMPYLHLPVQSGSDRILAAMNRQHTRDDYLRHIDRIRTARPDIAMASDFIVGFPGETDADFDDTLRLVREVGYAQAYSFKYSPRPGTPAAEKDDQIDEKVKSERLAVLQELLDGQQREFNTACVGKVMPVLFDRPGRRQGQLAGRSAYGQAVYALAGRENLGRIAGLHITGAGANSLTGTLHPAARDGEEARN